MTLIVTVDELFGLAFGKRRQSRDKALTRDLMKIADGGVLYAREYSRLIFDEAGADFGKIVFCENPASAASGKGFAFIELALTRQELDLADRVIIYSWNRRYPSTAKLDVAYIKANFTLLEEIEFVGNSHEKLTRYTYKRK